MPIAEIFSLFEQQIAEYHKTDSVDAPSHNPYVDGSFEHLLWEKNHVDTVQWHLEDMVRPVDVDPQEALLIKRRIDSSNQRRTDLVEHIDDHYMQLFANVTPIPGANINTETPAWAIDRLSILALKLYHYAIEVARTDSTPEHHQRCQRIYSTLIEQKADLISAIDTLLDDLAKGRKIMKLYRQMKMYNDPSLNPMLYHKKG